MDEILKQLLQSDLLSEESKAEITAKFNEAVEQYLASEKAKIEVDVRASLTEEFVSERDKLVEKVEAQVNAYLDAEFTELHEEINKFRDLEVEYAEKLVEAKEELAQTLGTQLNELVEKIDAFLEVRLDEEFTELHEDIDQVKKYEFGRRIFEAMEQEFKVFRKTDLDQVEQKLAEAEDQLADAKAKIADMESARLSEARTAKLDELLTPLSGTARDQMKIILSNVPTQKLDEAFQHYVGRILKETTVAKKDEPVKKDEPTVVVEDKKAAPAAVVVTGNESLVTEAQDNTQPNDSISRIRKLAGLTR